MSYNINSGIFFLVCHDNSVILFLFFLKFAFLIFTVNGITKNLSTAQVTGPEPEPEAD